MAKDWSDWVGQVIHQVGTVHEKVCEIIIIFCLFGMVSKCVVHFQNASF